MTDTGELSRVLAFTGGTVVPTDIDIVAGDIDHDGAIDTTDFSSYLAISGGTVVVDYEAREVA